MSDDSPLVLTIALALSIRNREFFLGQGPRLARALGERTQ